MPTANHWYHDDDLIQIFVLLFIKYFLFKVFYCCLKLFKLKRPDLKKIFFKVSNSWIKNKCQFLIIRDTDRSTWQLTAMRCWTWGHSRMRWSGWTSRPHVLLLEGLVGARTLTKLVLLRSWGWHQMWCIRGVWLWRLRPSKPGGRLVGSRWSAVSRRGWAATHGPQMRVGVGLLVCVRWSHWWGRGSNSWVGTSTTHALRPHWPYWRDTTGSASWTRLC